MLGKLQDISILAQIVARHSRQKPTLQKDLPGIMHIRAEELSRRLGALEKKGMIRRARKGRTFEITPTSKAKSVVGSLEIPLEFFEMSRRRAPVPKRSGS